MAFIELTRDLFENTSTALRPKVKYLSSSIGGVTGSEFVSPIRSKCIKELVLPSANDIQTLATHPDLFDEDLVGNNTYDIMDFTSFVMFEGLKNFASLTTDITKLVDTYMKSMSDLPVESRFSKKIDINKITPTHAYTNNTAIKNSIRNTIMPYHIHRYDNSTFTYQNYHTLNFYTASNVNTGSCLIYPNVLNSYTPLKDFTLSFWINPRYTNEPGREYNAGTIFHMSSSICVSLISGSQKSIDETVSSYKILVQLSQSADVNPSKILFGAAKTYPQDLVFTSSFELSKNHWHHVDVRWGGPNIDNYTGSIIIDGNESKFSIPSSSIATTNDGIFIGNYYDGPNSNIKKFFNTAAATNEGIVSLDAGTTDPVETTYNFHNPLNAEIHEIKLYNKFLRNEEIFKSGSGLENLNDVLFYLPPHFYADTRNRNMLVTPFYTAHTASHTPFNTSMSFSVGGRMINLENFVKEFKLGYTPRLLKLFPIVTTDTTMTVDEFINGSEDMVKRNFTILPCDNGKFFPRYDHLSRVPTQFTSSYYNINGEVDYSLINLAGMESQDVVFGKMPPQNSTSTVNDCDKQSVIDEVIGPTPERPDRKPTDKRSIIHNTRDFSSNEIVIFNISNIYYGNRINPSSFCLLDDNLSGSHSKIKVKVKDNGRGGLYRADCLTQQATWSNIGNLFYDEGVAIIKTPHLINYCNDSMEIDFKGEQNIHTLIINVPVFRHILNKSENPTYVDLPPTDYANDSHLKSLSISGINIHDENFNIIMKANFSQPITKTDEDEFVIRLKEDF